MFADWIGKLFGDPLLDLAARAFRSAFEDPSQTDVRGGNKALLVCRQTIDNGIRTALKHGVDSPRATSALQTMIIDVTSELDQRVTALPADELRPIVNDATEALVLDIRGDQLSSATKRHRGTRRAARSRRKQRRRSVKDVSSAVIGHTYKFHDRVLLTLQKRLANATIIGPNQAHRLMLARAFFDRDKEVVRLKREIGESFDRISAGEHEPVGSRSAVRIAEYLSTLYLPVGPFLTAKRRLARQKLSRRQYWETICSIRADTRDFMHGLIKSGHSKGPTVNAAFHFVIHSLLSSLERPMKVRRVWLWLVV